MRKIFAFILFAGLCFACGDDDSDDKAPVNNGTEQPDTAKTDTTKTDTTQTDTTSNDTVTPPEVVSDTIALAIAYNGTSVSIEGATDSLDISQSGAHVTITSTASRFMEITLSGSTTNGSLLVYTEKKFGIVLNGVRIENPNGPAINNQCGKALYITLADGTSNTLTDGETYGTAPVNSKGESIDQKGALFSEGQIFFNGNGTLGVNANGKNGIASDDYIVLESGNIGISVASSASNGVKVNDGLTINGGKLKIVVSGDGKRGIKSDSYVNIAGGSTTISTSGDCLVETENGVKDTTSCAGIKCDSTFTMSGGELSITSTGDGGKGINCAQQVIIAGGTLSAITSGSNDIGKPKAVKGDGGIILKGGSFTAKCKKSWACDNGSDSDLPSDHLTIIGTPSQKTIEKRNVIVVF